LVSLHLQGDAFIWWASLKYSQIMELSDEEFEKLFLDRWSHTNCRDEERTKGLFLGGKYILKFHGRIQKENIIVSINPSCQQNLINVHLVNRL
jgi:hypothetical protein